MVKTFQKLLYSGALVGALGLSIGCNKIIDGDETGIVNDFFYIHSSQEGKYVTFTHFKRELNNLKMLQNDWEMLQLGKYDSPLNIQLIDYKCDGIIDVIKDSNGTIRRNQLENILETKGELAFKKERERFEKADKLFTKYRSKLSDQIAKAEKEWKAKYSLNSDPLDNY